jgi:hypothetical protein
MERFNPKRMRRRLRALLVRFAGELTLAKCVTFVTLAIQVITLVRMVAGHG